ncbi:hydrogenase expression/formation protein HypE [Helicobacter sp.]|uniref:hydrogenase expression/formation protein HypE n=1 Tax=Helicobacter sp. TaxID=218 RepID=UPI0037512FF7|nr:hydrogenase expression/formation protein HypE [Helicobacter sp.]
MRDITLAHGSGGIESQELIQSIFLKHLAPHIQGNGEDAGIARGCVGTFAMSTDSYVITPYTFRGGDIGKLSVCGSSNDVAMMGARPMYMSAGFIIEEGFDIQELESLVKSMATELMRGNLKLLSADTKVVPKGSVDKIFINTTAYGEVIYQNLSAYNLQNGDCIIVSGNVGTHGSMVYCERNEIGLVSSLESDCAQLFGMLETLFVSGVEIHALRDATRGGIASVLNEWAQASNVGIDIEESHIPILEEVRGVCEILGLEPYVLANEGVCVLSVPQKDVAKTLEILHAHPLGKNACVIGKVHTNMPQKVILHNPYGTKRYLEYPQGEILPRIC